MAGSAAFSPAALGLAVAPRRGEAAQAALQQQLLDADTQNA